MYLLEIHISLLRVKGVLKYEIYYFYYLMPFN